MVTGKPAEYADAADMVSPIIAEIILTSIICRPKAVPFEFDLGLGQFRESH